jgi:hypothetical protein
MRMMKLALAAALLLETTVAGNTLPASASTSDGSYSVIIITEKGTCGRAYLDNVNVSHGRVAYQGAAPIDVAGTVAPSGAIRVSIKAGSQGANGTGRLLASGGRGVWHGHGSSGECAGRWIASRH